MYDDFVQDASFWIDLCQIDVDLRDKAVAKDCPVCGGPLHVADYPRKPRGIPEGVDEAFSTRLSTCCGRCRRRCTPPSVRFLGRRVYAGAIVLLATMRALVCGAAMETLRRWSAWWTQVLPSTTFWLALRARFVPPVEPMLLPGSLLQRYEGERDRQSSKALVATLRVLSPTTTLTAVRTVDEGGSLATTFTQKMQMDLNLRALVRRAQAPPKTT